jgi:hypothetical protein
LSMGCGGFLAGLAPKKHPRSSPKCESPNLNQSSANIGEFLV